MNLPQSIERTDLVCPRDEVPLSLVNGRWLFCSFCMTVTERVVCSVKGCPFPVAWRGKRNGSPFCRLHGHSVRQAGVLLVAA